MGTVRQILSKKTYHIITVTPETSVIDALKIMAEKNIGSVVVMENDAYLGIMTERDYARKVILKDKHSNDTTVGTIMSTDLPRVNPNNSVEQCMQLMADGNVRYLPVFENGVLVGVVSILDVIHEQVDRQKETIGQLRDFISSNFA